MNDANIDAREVPSGYIAICLGKHGNPNMTYFRKVNKVRGKAAVKRAKRARQNMASQQRARVAA